MALACIQAGQFKNAKTLLDEYCKQNSLDAQGWFLLGAVSSQLGDMANGIRYCRSSIELDSTNVDAHYNLAQAYMHTKAYQEAATAYRKVLELQPEHVRALNNLGYLLQQIGRYAEAASFHKKALRLAPNDPEILNNLGNALSGVGKTEEAVSFYKKSIALNPQYVQALNNLGGEYKKQGKISQAIQVFDRALRIQPAYSEALINKGIVLQTCGRAKEADEYFERALEQAPDSMRAISGRLFNLNYFCEDPARSFKVHAESAAAVCRRSAERLFARRNGGSERPLRIGFVSADFRHHSVAYFFQSLLAAHNRRFTETWCYARVEQPDDMTERLKTRADHWIDITALSAEAVVRQIKKDKIDILVDLAGHTEPKIMEVFAYRAAPVQVSWLGYPNTTGLSTMDYRLTDRWADPEGESDRLHSERLMRLPKGFLCYQPPEEMPEVGELPAAKAGYITFGSFNNLAKVTPEVVKIWSRVLKKIPGSRLVLKAGNFQDKEIQEYYFQLFAKMGIDRQRLDLLGFVKKVEHYNLYNRIDIALDTFPYNGTTTTCEALWMGVPVIALAGNRHAARVGVGLLSQLGLENWIACDKDEYVSLATQWDEAIGELADVRAGLRRRMAASNLCDSTGFARQIEAAFAGMWEAAVALNHKDG